jgi:hypothetical protein
MIVHGPEWFRSPVQLLAARNGSCRTILPSDLHENPGPVSHPGSGRSISSEGSLSPSRKPLRQFWYTGACCEPGCTSFPLPPDFRGYNSQKPGIRTGIQGNFPAGIGKVTFSDVTLAKKRGGCVSGGGIPEGDFPAPVLL